MTTKNIRFLLKEIELYYDGDKFVDEGNKGRKPLPKGSKNKKVNDNIVEATLIYPRSGAAAVSSKKVCDLPSRTKVEFDTDDFWESGLFKEDIDGETQFLLSISDRDSVSWIEKWFKRILSGMFGAAVGPKVKAISNLFQGAVAGDVQSQIQKTIKSEQGEITNIGKSKPIIVETFPRLTAYYLEGSNQRKVNVLNGNEMLIDLYSTTTVKRKVVRRANSSAITKQNYEVVFKKNEKIGMAKIIVQ